VDPFVFAAVLLAAACHAGWNAFLKVGLDPFTTTALIAVMSAMVALPALPFVGFPPAVAWPWIIASMVLHLGYYIGLTEAYRTGDMGQVYPIARGSAPLMTAVASTFLVGEKLSLQGWLGILVLVSGVFLLSLRGGRDLARIDRRALGFAFFTAVTICGYSVVDGSGGRIAQNPHAYAVMLFLVDGLMMLAFAVLRRGTGVFTMVMPYWKNGLTGGTMSLLSYWIAIWAMSVAPIAIVAALRETSVLFGAAIAVVVLKEPVRPARIVAALMIVAGLALIRLA
jgi:drug/metabolite transporter (DMT)-like permease